ncbi:hypothetical protein AAF454_03815 [Kurthia gibsonii]|uniref:Uncharacterized protein n=1 Tax=Kurthia gibsonii TaxID=33946 RepID=A0ABU9LJH3_9BACL|nr:hypothetical protein [Kurthia sp. 11kri321]AMA62772.1 hypothetical protein ASO14_814 [Kurthia sp. 11kri321]
MINWSAIKYDINSAKKDFECLVVKSKSVEPISVNEKFTELRESLIAARNDIFEEHGMDSANKLDYNFDLLFGLKLYEILNESIGFSNRIATDDDVWRYLSVCIVPDIVHSRWSLNADHFYKTPRRIWLKTIWWYIHLSWQNDSKQTYEILKNNSTDTILQLVERPGVGYYVEMYREIMLQYHRYGDSDRDLFRNILKLNTARIMTTSPELVEGGVKQYVTELFETVKGA